MANEPNRSRIENLLLRILGENVDLEEPLSRIEDLLYQVADIIVTLDEHGLIPINEIPPAAIEHLVTVVDDTARFALTTDDVENGDTVYVNATKIMYMVVDDTHLDSETGYKEYSAGIATKAIADQLGNTIDTYYQRLIDNNNKLDASLIDDSESVKKLTTAIERLKLARIIMDSLENNKLYVQETEPVIEDTETNSTWIKGNTISVLKYDEVWTGTIEQGSWANDSLTKTESSTFCRGSIPVSFPANTICINALTGAVQNAQIKVQFRNSNGVVTSETSWAPLRMTILRKNENCTMTVLLRKEDESTCSPSDFGTLSMTMSTWHPLTASDFDLTSWTPGSATSHSTPAVGDSITEALQKIDNNQRNDESNILSKIGASDYASQNTGGTVRVWTTTDGTDTILHISNEAPTP